MKYGATTIRLTEKDRAAVALLKEHLGEETDMSQLVRDGLRELLRKHNLKLPQPAPRKSPAKKRT